MNADEISGKCPKASLVSFHHEKSRHFKLTIVSRCHPTFMTAGAMKASSEDRKKLATKSHAWNVSQRQFLKVFPEYAVDKVNAKDLPNMGKGVGASGSSTTDIKGERP